MPQRHHIKETSAGLTLLALGIVYGDIGTSPLYAIRETFNPAHGIVPTVQNIIGGISAVFWAIMIVVSLKYVGLILRANNRGEGGIMALLALAQSSIKDRARLLPVVVCAGIFGAALFYGDAVLTPAISVVSAVEGLEIGTSVFKPYILPISVAVIAMLFLFQRYGTALIGTFFGPVMIVWFLSLGAVGIHGIMANPVILHALNPLHAFHFITAHGVGSFLVLGAVLLAFIGAEALYADMGHFGKRPIRIAWFGLVFPSLALNYLGQGALLASDIKTLENPFYLLFPSWALYPMIVLATMATIIASQATISGTYSLTKQAIQLGFLPRMNISHTSAKTIGQIYMPGVTIALAALVIGAVLLFGSSSNLAGAYGISVTGTMLITTFLTFFVLRFAWGYNLFVCVLTTAFFMTVDLAFFSSSLAKVLEGGWFPLTLGAVVFVIMMTWRRGREILYDRLRDSSKPLHGFVKNMNHMGAVHIDGTAVFLTRTPDMVPHALLSNLNHNKALHDRNIFLTVEVLEIPRVPFNKRVTVEPLGNNCFRIILHYGFKNRPDVTKALTEELAGNNGLTIDMAETSFFLSRDVVIPSETLLTGMSFWRDRLFETMIRNQKNAVEYFNIPVNRVVELGSQIEI
ncbi:potassium transporter Kup [bacterium]|nr:potassium transporter Kup [bacterium]